MYIVLGIQTNYDRLEKTEFMIRRPTSPRNCPATETNLGDLVVPLVAHVSVILEAHHVVRLGELIAHAEFRHESRIIAALLVEYRLLGVPPHHGLQHGAQESTVSIRLVLGARGNGIRYITEQLRERTLISNE